MRRDRDAGWPSRQRHRSCSVGSVLFLATLTTSRRAHVRMHAVIDVNNVLMRRGDMDWGIHRLRPIGDDDALRCRCIAVVHIREYRLHLGNADNDGPHHRREAATTEHLE